MITLKKYPFHFVPENDTVKMIPAEPVTKVVEVKHKLKCNDTVEKIRVKVKPVDIDFDGIEARIEILPLSAGNYGNQAR